MLVSCRWVIPWLSSPRKSPPLKTAVRPLTESRGNMQIELSLEEIDFLQSVLNHAEKLPINYAIFKKLGAAYERGLTLRAVDVAYCYGKDNHLLKEGELCGECGFPKPPRR